MFGFKDKSKQIDQWEDSRDGNIYKTVKIGSQVWMAENLRFKTDSNCWYGKDDFAPEKIGCFYDWYAANEACPDGWHIPTLDEWKELTGGFEGNIKALISKKDGGTNKSEFDLLCAGTFFIDVINGQIYSSWFTRADGESSVTLWTSTDEYGYGIPYVVHVEKNNKKVEFFTQTGKAPDSHGLPVRCIKNS